MDRTMPATHRRNQASDPSAIRPLIGALISLIVLMCTAVPSRGQVEPIEPTWMVATRDAPMRCGDGPTFYKVADLKRGQVVRMDAKDLKFGRVVYPAGLFAYVAKNDAVLVDDKHLKLASEESKIRSPNAISELAGSWRSLYMGSVKPGAVLEILGEVKANTGQVTGYRIVPPVPPVVEHPPYGYVELAAVRAATEDEVKAHLAALEPEAAKQEAKEPVAGGSEPGGAIDTAKSTEPEVEPAHPETTGEPEAGGETGGGAQPAEGTGETDNSLIDEMVPPEAGAESGPTGIAPDAQAEPSGAENAAEPPAQPEEAAPPRDWMDWTQLEAELRTARGKGSAYLEDELEELIAEYERTLGHAESEPMRRALNLRLDWLKLRKEARDQRRAIDSALKQAEEVKTDAAAKIRTWQSERYDIVGRLVPSTIYDGKRLPRMYRIRAAGEAGLVRTIGYVRDVPNLRLEEKVGRVVGVVGQSRLDDALHLRVITPSRIDTLEAKPVPGEVVEPAAGVGG